MSEAARPESAPYRRSTDVWDEGLAYWWDLSEVVCFERPIPCRGNVGMWQMPSDLADRVAAADQLAGEKAPQAQQHGEGTGDSQGGMCYDR